MAAGSVTITMSVIPTEKNGVNGIVKASIAWTGASSGGAVPATAFSTAQMAKIIGRKLSLAITNPGTTAPTADYDITITDVDGVDVMGGSLIDRATATSEQAVPLLATSTYGPRLITNTLTFNLANNSVNSAVGVCDLYFEA